MQELVSLPGTAVALAPSGALPEAPSREDLRAVAEQLDADAVLVVRVSPGRGPTVTMQLIRGEDLRVLRYWRWRVARARAIGRLPKDMRRQLAAALEEARPPRRPAPAAPADVAVMPPAPIVQATAEPEPPPQKPEPPPARAPTARPPVSAPIRARSAGKEVTALPPNRPMALELAVGAGAVSRTYGYPEGVPNGLASYRLPGGSATALHVEWFPWAAWNAGALGHVGVVGHADVAVGVQSMVQNTAYPTRSDLLWGGIKARLPVGMAELFATVEYAQRSFALLPGDGTSPRPRLPDVQYGGPRAALGARLGGRFQLELSAGYQHLTRLGEVATQAFFPRAAGRAFEARVGAAWWFQPALGVRAAVDFHRYLVKTNAQEGDAWATPRIEDDYVSGALFLVIALR
jgi:hypothetical protein